MCFELCSCFFPTRNESGGEATKNAGADQPLPAFNEVDSAMKGSSDTMPQEAKPGSSVGAPFDWEATKNAGGAGAELAELDAGAEGVTCLL